MRMRGRIIGVSILILSVGIGSIFLTQRSSSVGSEELSARSKEYLAKRPENDKTSLEFAAVEDETQKTVVRDKTLIADGCLRVTIPFRIANFRQEGECFIHAAVRLPTGTVNVYRKYEPVVSLDDIPGVPMRRLNKELYKEDVKSIKGHEYLLFSKIDTKAEISAFRLAPGGYIVVNFLIGGIAEYEEEMIQLLSSVEALE